MVLSRTYSIAGNLALAGKVAICLCIPTLLLLVSCNSNKPKNKIASTQRQIILQAQNPATAQLVIENKSTKEAHFFIKLNQGFYNTETQIAEEVKKMPDEYEGEPLQRKAWRYVIQHVKFSKPVTSENWQHAPMLMINSVGTGLCDDLSATLNIIWKKLGYQSRVWSLEGHVVPEVLINGKWQMYDPLYQVYYLNDKNEIAGVEELAANPHLITQLTNKAPIKNQGALAYALGHSKKAAGIYATDSNNVVSTWFDSAFNLADTMFILPAGAIMKLPVYYKGQDSATTSKLPPDHSLLSVQISSTGAAHLYAPLVLFAIEGEGNVSIDNKEFVLNSEELNNYLLSFSSLHQHLTFSGNTRATVYYLLNNRAVTLRDTNTLALDGFETASLTACIQENVNAPVENSTEKLDSLVKEKFVAFDKKMEQRHMQVPDFFTAPTGMDNIYERVSSVINLEDQLSTEQKKEKVILINNKIKSLLEALTEETRRKKLFTALSDPHVFIMFITYMEYRDAATVLGLLA